MFLQLGRAEFIAAKSILWRRTTWSSLGIRLIVTAA